MTQTNPPRIWNRPPGQKPALFPLAGYSPGGFWVVFSLLVLVVAAVAFTSRTAWGVGYIVRRDTFPVFNNPTMISGKEAEQQGVVFPRAAVIGLVIHGDARAYPINIMGFHELGNDPVGGIPVAVTW